VLPAGTKIPAFYVTSTARVEIVVMAGLGKSRALVVSLTQAAIGDEQLDFPVMPTFFMSLLRYYLGMQSVGAHQDIIHCIDAASDATLQHCPTVEQGQ
jgi:hypothetical protein